MCWKSKRIFANNCGILIVLQALKSAVENALRVNLEKLLRFVNH
jgi:hypothetical protein